MNKSRKINSTKWLAASALLSAAVLAVVVATIMLATSGTSVMAQDNSDPDSTRAGAVSLGDITGQDKAKGGNHSIDGVNDVTDYFTFSLTDTREVMVKIKQMDQNADLYLEDQDGNELASSTEAGTADEAIFHELNAGTYYIRVDAMQRGSNIYKLRYRAREIIPENVAATGAPTISGTVEVGHTLSADTSGISDDNGLTNAQFAYQWFRSDNAISGATGSTYTLTTDDEGNTIKVKVSFTDDDGYPETLTSSATDTVEKPANIVATGQPAITGTAQVGDTLTADTSAISDENGLDNVPVRLPVDTQRRQRRHSDSKRDQRHVHRYHRRLGPHHQGAGGLHRRQRIRGNSDQRRHPLRQPATQRRPRRQADHHRKPAGGRNPVSGYLRHQRPQWPHQPRVQLPVDQNRRRYGHHHLGRNHLDLYCCGIRCRQRFQGHG